MIVVNDVSIISLVTVQLAASQQVLNSLDLVTNFYCYICRDRIFGTAKACLLDGAGWNPSVQD
jgi:hypothetical protein